MEIFPKEDALEVGKKSVEQAIKASTEGYEQTLNVTKEQVEKAKELKINWDGKKTSYRPQHLEATSY